MSVCCAILWRRRRLVSTRSQCRKERCLSWRSRPERPPTAQAARAWRSRSGRLRRHPTCAGLACKARTLSERGRGGSTRATATRKDRRCESPRRPPTRPTYGPLSAKEVGKTPHAVGRGRERSPRAPSGSFVSSGWRSPNAQPGRASASTPSTRSNCRSPRGRSGPVARAGGRSSPGGRALGPAP